MYTIQLTAQELNLVIKALQTSVKKKLKRAESWERKKQAGLLVPLEVADAFITIDTNAANLIKPLIEILETVQ